MKMGKILSLISAAALMVFVSGCVDQHPEENSSNNKAVESISAVGEIRNEYRIAATSVATCEILEALGVEDECVVGVPHSDAYNVPEIYSGAESLGSPMSPDLEILKSLDPTIVLTPNSLEGELRPQYDEIGVESYFLDLKSVDGMYESIAELGEMFGVQDKAAELVSEYEQYKSEISTESEEDAPKVLLLMGLPGSYVVATESSYTGSLVKLAGGENVYGDGDGQDFLNVNTEDMLEKDPDIILRTSHAMPEQVAIMFAEEFETNDIWKHFRAVENNSVYDLDHELCGMSATFRYKEGIEQIREYLYK